jgi:hypothetical protein
VPRSRVLTVAVALLGTSLLSGNAAAATELTSANSIPFEFSASSTETFSGVGCGTTATVTKTLPAGAMGIKVVEPAIGDRDNLGSGTQVTAITVAGTAVTITILADGPSICDPAQTGVPPGEPVNWIADYDVRIDYKRRVQSKIRIFYESYIFGAKWKLRPKTIRDTRAGGPPGIRVTGIRWKRFGGKKAVGFGRLRLDYCRPDDNCPMDGKPIRLVARKPDYCKDSDKIEYLRLAGYIGKLEYFGAQITCSA